MPALPFSHACFQVFCVFSGSPFSLVQFQNLDVVDKIDRLDHSAQPTTKDELINWEYQQSTSKVIEIQVNTEVSYSDSRQRRL